MDRLAQILDKVFLFLFPFIGLLAYLAGHYLEGMVALSALYIVRGLKSEDVS